MGKSGSVDNSMCSNDGRSRVRPGAQNVPYEDRLRAVLARRDQQEQTRIANARQRLLQTQSRSQRARREKELNMQHIRKVNQLRHEAVVQKREQILLEDHARKLEIVRKVELRCVKARESKCLSRSKFLKRRTSLSNAVFRQLDIKNSISLCSSTQSQKTKVFSKRPSSPKAQPPSSPKRQQPPPSPSRRPTNGATTGRNTGTKLSSPGAIRKKTAVPTQLENPCSSSFNQASINSVPLKCTPESLIATKGGKYSAFSKIDKQQMSVTDQCITVVSDESTKSKASAEIEFYKNKLSEHRRAMKDKLGDSTKLFKPVSETLFETPTSIGITASSACIQSLNPVGDTQDSSAKDISIDKLGEIMENIDICSKPLLRVQKQSMLNTANNAPDFDPTASLWAYPADANTKKTIDEDVEVIGTASSQTTANLDSIVEENIELSNEITTEEPTLDAAVVDTELAIGSLSLKSDTYDLEKISFEDEENRLMQEAERVRVEAEAKVVSEHAEFEREQAARRQMEEDERAQRKARLEAIMKRTRPKQQSPISCGSPENHHGYSREHSVSPEPEKPLMSLCSKDEVRHAAVTSVSVSEHQDYRLPPNGVTTTLQVSVDYEHTA